MSDVKQGAAVQGCGEAGALVARAARPLVRDRPGRVTASRRHPVGRHGTWRCTGAGAVRGYWTETQVSLIWSFVVFSGQRETGR
jgi:hypothetical protein